MLFISDGFFHPPWLGRKWLEWDLRRLPGFHFGRARSLNALARVGLGAWQAFILHYHHRQLQPSALDVLERFVASGGGVLALHAATASFKTEPGYFQILGARFTGHEPVGPVRVSRASHAGPIFNDLPAFTVVDELYRHEFLLDPQIHFEGEIIGTAGSERQPVVWSHLYRKGRVFYAGLGHRSATLRNPVYRQILQRGLKWVCGLSAAAEGGQ